MRRILLFFAFLLTIIYVQAQDMSSYMKKYLEQGNIEKVNEILNLGFDINQSLYESQRIPVKKKPLRGTYKSAREGRVPLESQQFKTEIIVEKFFPVEVLMKSESHTNHLEILKLLLNKGLDLSTTYDKVTKIVILETRKGSQYNQTSLENERIINTDKSSSVTHYWNNMDFVNYYNSKVIPSIAYLYKQKGVKINSGNMAIIKEKYFSNKNEKTAAYIVELGDIGIPLGLVYQEAKDLLNQKNAVKQTQGFFDDVMDKKLSKDEIFAGLEKDPSQQSVFNYLIANEDSTFVNQLIKKFPYRINSSLGTDSNYSKEFNYWRKYCPLSYTLLKKDFDRFKLLLRYGANPAATCVKNLSKNAEVKEFFDFELAKYRYNKTSISTKPIEENYVEDELDLSKRGEILETKLIFKTKSDLAKLNLSKGKKYLIIINSSASWCAACKSQLVNMSEFSNNIDAEIIHLLFPIPTKPYQEQFMFDQQFIKGLKNFERIPTLYIRQNLKNALSLPKQFDVGGYPFSIYIDDMKVKNIFAGAASPEEIYDAIK